MQAGTLRIVSSLPLRGTDGVLARLIQQAVDLAISQRLARAGEWRIEHIALDDGDAESGDWSAEKERENMQEAANDPSVVAVIGPYNSGATGVSLPITNRAHLLEIAASATWPGLTSQGWNPGEPSIYYPVTPHNLARIVPSDAVQGVAGAQWAHDDGIASTLVVDDGSSYSTGVGEAFADWARNLGMTVVGPVTISPPSTDITGLLQGKRPQAVFYGASTAGNAARLASALAASGSTLPVYATDTALSDQFLSKAGAGAEGWHIVDNSGAPPDSSPAWQAFAQSFRSRYSGDPTYFAGAAYDATNLVLDAITRVGSDRSKILTAVLSTAGYEGASGDITFTANGDNRYWRVKGLRYAGGRFEPVRTISGGS